MSKLYGTIKVKRREQARTRIKQDMLALRDSLQRMALQDAQMEWCPVVTAAECADLRRTLQLHQCIKAPDYMCGKAVLVCTTPETPNLFSGPDFVFYTPDFMCLSHGEYISGMFDPQHTTGEELTAHWNQMTGRDYRLLSYDWERRRLYLQPADSGNDNFQCHQVVGGCSQGSGQIGQGHSSAILL